MRKPKIGDIVLYHFKGITSPAIVMDSDNTVLKVFCETLQPYNARAFYSEKLQDNHWSWPEEEKPKKCEAEELIDKIWVTLNKEEKLYADFINIYHWIKEYKGIK